MRAIRPEDWQVLELFTWKIRVACREQIDALGIPSRKSVARLVGKGFLDVEKCLTRIPFVEKPLATWRPGFRTVDFSPLAWQLEQRRHSAKLVQTSIFWATARAVRFTGGCGGRIRQPFQVEHDLGTAAMFFRRCEICPGTWERWLGEDVFRRSAPPKQKIPDAVLCSDDGQLRMAIEYGGLYSPARLKRFHRHCAKRLLPYEIW